MSERIQEKAMIVTLAISQWTARRYDREISDEIEQRHNAQEAGRYNKLLIAKDEINKITQITNNARLYNYKVTLPWTDKGDRLLPSELFFDYIASMEKYKDQFEKAVKNFISKYQELKSEATIRLRDMYRDADYPDSYTLESRYNFNINILPIPDGKDFRVNLQNDEIVKIQKDIEERTKLTIEKSIQNLWKRFYEAISRMADQLSNKHGKIYDSLIGNIKELCHLLPALNITNDKVLNDMKEEIEKKLIVSAESLRENKKYRQSKAREARDIVNKMKYYMT